MKNLAIMWDQRGLEAVEEIPNPALMTWNVISDTPVPHKPNLMMWQHRARFNSDRHYEIYVIGVEDDISTQDVRLLFETDAQKAVDLVRQRGFCFYSNRVNTSEIKIW